ncbi:MAG: antiterminator LoaP [Clostridiales bacterium]|nr:antiterminator LoaP [Clostridiales bacterium]
MWYVIWTSTGSEERVARAVKDMTCQKRCFVPKRIMQIRKNGDWEYAEKNMFPGYFFVDTDDIEELSVQLRKVEGFSTVLTVDKKFYPLTGKDDVLTEELYNNNGIFDISKGIIEGDNIIVTSGPLKGQEGLIRKIDRHKRIAYLEFTMFDQKVSGKVGLEIVEKH